MRQSPSFYRLFLLVIVAFHASLLWHSAIKHSPTVDEGGHVLSGLVYWKTGRFTLSNVNPPLAKLWTSWPLLFTGAVVPYQKDVEFDQWWSDDHDLFLKHNAEHYTRYILLSRLMLIPVSVAGLLIVASWSRDLYGTAAGVLAGLLWATNPTLLAWGAVANTDISAATAGVAAMYGTAKWMKRPDFWNSLALGVLLGIAQLIKFTLLLLYPAILLLVLGGAVGSGIVAAGSQRRPRSLHLFVVLAVSVAVLHVGYSFASFGSRFDELPLHSATITQVRDALPWMRVPLPDAYLVGLDEQKSHADAGYPMYIRGQWYPRGFWYYYLYAGVIKEPLALFMFVGLALASLFVGCPPPISWKGEGALLLPFLAISCALSSQTGLNSHYRYALPALPFLIVFASRGVCAFSTSGHKVLRSLSIVAVCWSILTAIQSHPHHIGYFNEIVGGRSHGKSHLAESNIDWGQDLFFLRDWIREHCDEDVVGLAYFGPLDPAVAGVTYCFPGDETGIPCKRRDGACGYCSGQVRYVAISVNLLCGASVVVPTPKGAVMAKDDVFSEWRAKEPVAVLGSSIYVFDSEMTHGFQ